MPFPAGESSGKVKRNNQGSTGWERQGGGVELDELATSWESGVGVPYEK